MLKCDSILMLQISKVIVTKEDSDSDSDSEFVGREEIRAPLKTPAWEAKSRHSVMATALLSAAHNTDGITESPANLKSFGATLWS